MPPSGHLDCSRTMPGMAVLALAWAVRKAPPFGQLHSRQLLGRAMVVVEGAAVRLLSRRSTMLAIVLGVFGLGFPRLGQTLLKTPLQELQSAIGLQVFSFFQGGKQTHDDGESYFILGKPDESMYVPGSIVWEKVVNTVWWIIPSTLTVGVGADSNTEPVDETKFASRIQEHYFCISSMSFASNLNRFRVCIKL